MSAKRTWFRFHLLTAMMMMVAVAGSLAKTLLRARFSKNITLSAVSAGHLFSSRSTTSLR